MRTEPDGQAIADDLADAAERIAFAFHRVDLRDHRLFGILVERAKRRGVGGGIDVVRQRLRPPSVDSPEMDDVARDAHTEFGEQSFAHRRGSDARRRLARRRALENIPGIGTSVF